MTEIDFLPTLNIAKPRILACRTTQPLHFFVCGQLLSQDGFLHHRRTFEYHVLILILEGTLHITANEVAFSLTPGQYLFLKAGEEHFGHKPSEGRLSYLWVHFQADDALQTLVFGTTIPTILPACTFPDTHATAPSYTYCFPECSTVPATKRATLLFHQLMDLSLEDALYSSLMPDYALSLLLMELTQEYLQSQSNSSVKLPAVILSATEWIKANYRNPFTVSQLANELGYQSDYLSSLFKQTTGTSITRYTNELRIKTSKTLLTNYDLSIKEAAYSCGFSDEKYFMKVFKQLEGMTPTQYKTAFSKKLINPSFSS